MNNCKYYYVKKEKEKNKHLYIYIKRKAKYCIVHCANLYRFTLH